MSEDHYTEYSSESWFSRIRDSIKGILFGFILIAAAIIVLFWNEGRAVARYKTLQEGRGAVMSVMPNEVIPENEGKLVHMSGEVKVDESVSDPIFNVSSTCVKLKRHVEMYQWEEDKTTKEKKKIGGSKEKVTTYTYKKKWNDRLIHSDDFSKPEGHSNPAEMIYQSDTFTASNPRLGAFKLSSGLIHLMRNYKKHSLNSKMELPRELSGKAKIVGGKIYIGKDPANPEIGDMKISFKKIKPSQVSLITKQSGDSFSPYRTSNGGTIEILKSGTWSAQDLLKDSEESNAMLTWILRAGGFIIMGIGFSMLFAPLGVLADVLPLLGTIVSAGTGFIAFLLAGIISLFTISLAWIFYRPLIGVPLILLAASMIFLMKSKISSKSRRA